VVAVIDRPVVTPGRLEAHRDDHFRPQPAECRSQVAAERYAVLDQAVGVIKEPDLADPHGRGAAALLFLAKRPGPARRQPCDAGLAACRQQIADLPALAGPPGYRGGRAVLKVIGVRHHHNGAVPVLGQGLHRLLLRRAAWWRLP